MLRSRLLARLAVELYYAEDRARSETLSAQAVAAARSAGDPVALAAALNARHVALWRPDRIDERLAVAAEMIAVARDGDRVGELQARNWRVLDLFELGDMDEWRAEVRRHGRLADELRLPTFQWYTPLWQAVDAMLAGRFAQADRLRLEAAAMGTRAGDLNGELFARMIEFTANVMRRDFLAPDLEFALDKVANSPAGPAYRPSVAWLLAELGRHDEARAAARALPGAGAASPSTPTGRRRSAECAERGLRTRRPRARRGDLRPAGARSPGGRSPRAAPSPPTAPPIASSASSRRCSAATPTPSAISVRRSRSTRRWAPPSGPPTAGWRYRHCGPRARALRADVVRQPPQSRPSERVRRQPAVVTGRAVGVCEVPACG